MSDIHEVDYHEFVRMQRRMARVDSRLRLILAGALVTAVAAVLLWAPRAMSEPDQPVTTAFPDMYQFSANTPAIAAEVNSNFSTVRGLAADNAAAIGDNAADIAGLQSGKFDKSGGTVTGNMAVNGRLNVGVRLKQCTYTPGSAHSDCSCDSNEVVISGGAYGSNQIYHDQHSLRESRPMDTRTWRVACLRDDGYRRDCLGFQILCARLK
ncbi:hypothetical protein [Haliangium sp.]|uniref:hypothetical protein n=1 Tax=Haliangium sp. TaxID=2663208 RepID=UPI003D106202